LSIQIIPIPGLPEVEPGADLASLLVAALTPLGPEPGDIVVVTQKVVSKSENAVEAADTDADYRRIVERESALILRRRGDLVISVTHHGFVCANAGVDRSNVSHGSVALLPKDPDRSAQRLRAKFQQAFGVDLPVIITDTFGRAWRTGLVDVAIGVAGMNPVLDLRGTADTQGRILEVTEIAQADEIAAAAELAMGKASGIAAVLVRGVAYQAGDGRATDMVRTAAEDMFR
jgi:coenzyme F420-0:L-glutamate ligase / coenzyme F420-1:gamma-L-glutamate ligase